MNTFSRGSMVGRAFFCVFLNILISLLLTATLFHKAWKDVHPWFIGNLLMFLSTAILINFAWAAPVVLLALARAPRFLVAGLAALLGSVTQIILLVDTRVFAVFKYHINGFVLNFLTTEGASDSLSLHVSTWLTFAAACAGIIAAEVFLARRALYRETAFAFLRRRSWTLLAALCLVVLSDKALYIYADLTNRASVLSAARYYPAYFGITAKRTAARWFGFKVDRENAPSLRSAAGTLNYPHEPLTFAPDAPRPNIVILVADGLRADMLNDQIMPRLNEFARHNTVLQKHFSGGTDTRFGIFSLFYGLYGNLWHPFLASRQGPVFIDALLDRNYQMLILSSTKLTFPEFRKTVFARVPESIRDESPLRTSWERDTSLTEQFGTFLDERDPARPFFSFMFFNSSHPFYRYPPEFEKFTPVVPQDVNYMGDISQETADKLKNRYRNALYYSDTLFQRVLDDLSRRGLMENTIFIITGDHGEEFKENGFFSHSSAFDDYQAQTAFVMHMPGVDAQTVARMTSHLDVVPTLLNRMGCLTPPSAYSHGRDLFTDPPRDYAFCADWACAAIMTMNERLVLPIGAGKGAFIELRDAHTYKLIEDSARMVPLRPHMREVAKDLGRFYK